MSENTDPTNNADPIKNQESESVQTPRSARSMCRRRGSLC